MQETQEKQVQSPGFQEDPLEEETATHSSTLTWESHGQRSLADYGLWGHKESDMTEHTYTHKTQKIVVKIEWVNTYRQSWGLKRLEHSKE